MSTASGTSGDAHEVLDATTARLRQAGCVAAEEEAAELMDATAGDEDRLAALVDRRCQGEPLAWLVGSVTFCGQRVVVVPGVYVPRWQSEPLARKAATRLPHLGLAIDLCTGSGAIAVALQRLRPEARVLATELDPVAVACARLNEVEVYQGDLAAGLPDEVVGRVDVVTAVVPYVPTGELGLLPRDVTAFEPLSALDGGPDGTRLLARVAREAVGLLNPGGSLLLELGGDEADVIGPVLTECAYRDVELLVDDDGDARGLVARRGG